MSIVISPLPSSPLSLQHYSACGCGFACNPTHHTTPHRIESNHTSRRFCGGRLVSVLEGGYNLHAGYASTFARSVAAHVRALSEPHTQFWDPSEAAVSGGALIGVTRGGMDGWGSMVLHVFVTHYLLLLVCHRLHFDIQLFWRADKNGRQACPLIAGELDIQMTTTMAACCMLR